MYPYKQSILNIKHILPSTRLLENHDAAENVQGRQQRRLARPKKTFRRVARIRSERVKRVMLFTFIRFWSKFIRTQASVQRQWVSWTVLLMISLNGLLLRLPGWLITTNGLQSPVAKYKQQCDCCCQVNWRNMRSVKVPRQWLSTLVRSKLPFETNGPF